jgi:hypothetical protein
MTENKNDKFKRLAVTRVNKAVKAIELIGNLGNKALYESSSEERKKIIRAITDATAQMKVELEGDSKKKDGFKFE